MRFAEPGRAIRPVMGSRKSQQKGFTLVELLVTVAIAVVLTVIALPSLRTMVQNTRRDSAVDGLVASLHYARNQALDLNQTTTLCAGTAGVTTDGSCKAGVWINGWQVITKPANGDASAQLTVHKLNADSPLKLTAKNSNTALIFNGRGLLDKLSSGNEVIVVCDARGASQARAVEITSTGYIQASAKIGTAPDGTALTCT